MQDTNTEPARVRVDDERELAEWSRRLATAPEKIKAAVEAVGDSPDKVREHLASQQGAGYN